MMCKEADLKVLLIKCLEMERIIYILICLSIVWYLKWSITVYMGKCLFIEKGSQVTEQVLTHLVITMTLNWIWNSIRQQDLGFFFLVDIFPAHGKAVLYSSLLDTMEFWPCIDHNRYSSSITSTRSLFQK